MLFSRARGALKGWSSRSPQASRTGADPLIWYLLGLTISEVCPPAAAAMLLQLDTYARPTEILQLCGRDIIKPASRHCKFWGVIFGNSEVGDVTKTGTQDDTVLLDSSDGGYVGKVLQAVFSRARSQDDPLFPSLTLAKYEQLFRDAKCKLKLGQFGLTPHMLFDTQGPRQISYLKQELPLRSKQEGGGGLCSPCCVIRSQGRCRPR